jgi:CheY-like chemotaxis protein
MSIACAEFETATQSELFGSRGSSTSVVLLHCLVLAEDAERRTFLAEAAEAAGWEVTLATDAQAASSAANRFRQSLMIVDLDRLEPDTASRFRNFTERVGDCHRPLLMVCGTEGNALEEIWARQLGVWLYLSGVDETCDIASLCQEAQHVAEKLLPQQSVYARTA